MARIPQTTKAMKAQRGRLVDVQVWQSHDLVKYARTLKSRYFFKPLEKYMARALIAYKIATQKNITASKAVLSGFMRNSFETWMERPKLDILIGFIGSRIFYTYLVHEGLGSHRTSKLGRKPKSSKISNKQKDMIPKSIRQMQKQLLKYKKVKVKGRRPFFEKAIKERTRLASKLIDIGIAEGAERAAKRSKYGTLTRVSK